MELKGKVALVTGAAHRVGKGIALALAREGMDILVHYYSSGDELPGTLDEIRALGVRAEPFQADQSVEQQVAEMFAHVRETFGALHVLVNSGSIFTRGDVMALEPARWRRTLDVNLTGPYLCSRKAVPLMRESGGGCIVNILDNAAFQAWPDFAAHSVAKAGLLSLTDLLAKTVAPEVRANAVVPGPVDKPVDMTDARWAEIAAGSLLKRNGSPADVGRAVVFLAREDFCTGTVLHVDGGERVQ